MAIKWITKDGPKIDVTAAAIKQQMGLCYSAAMQELRDKL